MISQLEQVFARESVFGLYRLGEGPPPRHKNKPDSGTVEPRYAVVKDSSIGGYSEVFFRVREFPKTLPCIELDVTGGKGARIHGQAPDDVNRLVSRLIASVSNPPNEAGCVGEISCEFVEEDVPLSSDPDFWPRVLLDLRDKLKIRARTPEEAKRLMELIIPLAEQGVFSDHSRWITGEIAANAPHHVSVAYDESEIFRVIAKIAYGVLVARLGPIVTAEMWFDSLRRFISGEEKPEENLPVIELSEPGNFRGWPEYHLALIFKHQEDVSGVVILYGACHSVRFGKGREAVFSNDPVVAISRRDGTDTRIADPELSQKLEQEIRRHTERLVTDRKE